MTASHAPTTFTLAVDGVALEAAWVGPPRRADDDGPVLVFLHEGLGSIAQWHDTPALIAAAVDLPALVYARQGYGASTPIVLPRPLTYMHDEAARLPAILAAAGVRDAIVVGHSDGASIAIIAAGTRAIVPRALVLIAPHVSVEDVAVASIARAADAYRTGDLRARLAKYHADVDGAFWGWNRAWLDPAFAAWNLEALVPAITAPTLIVQGTADAYGTVAQVDAIVARLGGRYDVALIDGAGHSPFRDRPAEVHARIAALVINAVRACGR